MTPHALAEVIRAIAADDPDTSEGALKQRDRISHAVAALESEKARLSALHRELRRKEQAQPEINTYWR